MATQSDEFGTKVALLAGLVVLCAARPILDRFIPAKGAAEDQVVPFARRALLGDPGTAHLPRRVGGVAAAAIALLMFPVAVVIAGTPTRGYVAPETSELLNRTPVHIDQSTLPSISVGQDVLDYDHTLAGTGIQQVLVTLAQNLEVENQALLRRDESLLEAVDHGDRLIQMQGLLSDAETTGNVTVRHYTFDTVDVKLLVPFGKQTGLSLGFHVTGTATAQTYDSAGNVTSTTTEPVDTMFAVRRATGARWLNVGDLPPPS
jgi:hypothetical protein